MKFVPVDGTILFCIWKARVKDYEAFCAATGRQYDKPDFAQTGLHPVVKVSWHDAQALCKWLTEKERAEHMLEEDSRTGCPRIWNGVLPWDCRPKGAIRRRNAMEESR